MNWGEQIQKAFAALVEDLQGLLVEAVRTAPNLVAALVVLVIGYFVARGFRRLTVRVVLARSDNQAVGSILGGIVFSLLLAFAAFLALGVMNLDKTVSSLLAGAGILGLAFGLAIKDIASNYISGILLAIQQPFVVGDIIEVLGNFGVVDELSLKNTVLRSPQGQLIIVPNSKVFGEVVKNYSRLGRRRVDLRFGVSYGDDLERVQQVARGAIESLECVEAESLIDVLFLEFGGSSVDGVIRFWIRYPDPTDFFAATSQAVIAIHKAFRREGITIPFPIRTLDFGIVGGTPLSKELPALAGHSDGRN